MNVTANQVFPVQSDLPDEWLSLLGCGITTGLGAVFNVAKGAALLERRGRRARALGQWMVQAAKLAAARSHHRRRPDPLAARAGGQARRDRPVDPR